MNFQIIDKEIHNCNLCNEMVEKFPNSKTESIGKNNIKMSYNISVI